MARLCFDDDYDLMPLNDLEDFIQKNGHLPEMPTAKSVKQDGLPLGEANRLLTQKVEELTLYLIALEKKLNNMKMENQK